MFWTVEEEILVGSRGVGWGLVVEVVVLLVRGEDFGCFLRVGSMDVLGSEAFANLRRWVEW